MYLKKFSLELIVSRAATPLSHNKRCSRKLDVTAENIWIFEFGIKSGNGVALYVIVVLCDAVRLINKTKTLIQSMD